MEPRHRAVPTPSPDPANRWLPTSPCTPGCIPPRIAVVGLARCRWTLRVVGRLAAVATVLAVGLLAALVAPLLARSTAARVQRRWALALVTAAGLRLRRRGPQWSSGGVLVVANHVSWLDVLALHAVAPVRMLAKREVRGWPLIGGMAARVGTVFLDRDRLRELPDAVDGLAGALAAGTPVGVFAEGTTRCGRDLGPFRPAAFQAAIDAGVPVQPVALSYLVDGSVDRSAAFVGDDTLFSSLWRVVTTPRIDLAVTVLEPLGVDRTIGGPGRAGPRRALAARCAAVVATALALPAAPTSARAASPVTPTEVGPARTRTDDRALDRVA